MQKESSEQIGNKVSFWAFTGKWAIVIILVGIYLIYDKQYSIGVILILFSASYIYYRLNRLKKTKPNKKV